MYSKNDYRYYLENRLAHSDDYLAHYGVKGMKWKQHLKKRFNVYNDKGHNSYEGYNWSERGIESKKTGRYLSVGSRKYKNGTKTKDIYFTPTKKQHFKRIGRLRIDTGEEGSHISLDVSSKKRYKKNNKKTAAWLGTTGRFETDYIAKTAYDKAKQRKKK